MRRLGDEVLWRRVGDFINRYQPYLIGVTGSSNKTLTAQAIGQALEGSRHVRQAPPSSNMPTGIATAILGIERPSSHVGWMGLLARSLIKEVAHMEPDTIVVEIGAHRPGDVDWVARKLPLDIVVVTNVQSKNLRLFSSKEMVAHEHTSLLTTLAPDSYAILNTDDPLVMEMAEHSKGHVITFGQSDAADVRLMRLQRLPHHGFACEILVQGQVVELHAPQLVNRQQIHALLASLAVALVMRLDFRVAAKRLQQLQSPPGVMRLLPGLRQSLLLDDSYAASPEDTLIALESLRSLPGDRKIAILGDIVDLGGETYTWHRKIGKFAGEVASMVILVGDAMRDAGTEAIMIGADVHHFSKSTDVGKWLTDFIQPGDVVLIKGSRQMKMEEVTRALLANPQDEEKLVQ